MSKPDFLIVPGAWHGPETFEPTTKLLEEAGYNVHGITFPSIGGPPHIKDFQPDVAVIQSTLDAILSSGKDVVILYHSYGGAVGSEALSSYLSTLPSPPPGHGKVLRLVYICAFVLPAGACLMTGLGMKPLPWFRINEAGDEVRPDGPEEVFYNDIEDGVAKQVAGTLKPHAYRTFFSPLTVEPWKSIPSTYILCTLDKAIPIQAQEGMVAQAKSVAPESFDVVERLEASHSPFISTPEKLVKCLVKAAGGS